MLLTQRHSPFSDWSIRHLSLSAVLNWNIGRKALKNASQNNEDKDGLPTLIKGNKFYKRFGEDGGYGSKSSIKIIDADRSSSRGREAFSTGRGGIGNIRQSSLSRDTRPESGPDDFSVTRGREPMVNPKQVFSTGRGGVGNIRSPSRDVHKTPTIEEDVIRKYKISQEDAPVSSGRGGLGNINRSRSRDPISNPIMHSTGRGGVGNIVPGDGHSTESIDEVNLKKYHDHAMHDGYHSTGRGGNANITSVTEPAVEHHSHLKNEYLSTGRGGAGNIVQERSPSRD